MSKTKYKKNFFEGWYFKHMNADSTIAFIPSYHIDGSGKPSAYLQIINNDSSYSLKFSSQEFSYNRKSMLIKVGDSTFSKRGITIDINNKDLKIKACLSYYEITPPAYDIMGPFCAVPLLECRHGLVSFKHSVYGYININGVKYLFDNAIGYIEKDSGKSFPTKYLWSQCNFYEENDLSIMVSVAKVKVAKINFDGVIGAILYKGKEYRIATYKGANILEYTEHIARIKQGKLLLTVTNLSYDGHKLKAPSIGQMSRIIKEDPSCNVRYTLTDGKKTIFDLTSERASYEYSDTSIE